MKWNSKRRTYNMKKKFVGSWFANYKKVKFVYNIIKGYFEWMQLLVPLLLSSLTKVTVVLVLLVLLLLLLRRIQLLDLQFIRVFAAINNSGSSLNNCKIKSKYFIFSWSMPHKPSMSLYGFHITDRRRYHIIVLTKWIQNKKQMSMFCGDLT